MELTARELEHEFNKIVKDNEGAFEALSELVLSDVKSLCEENDIDKDEISAIMNSAQFNFQFKFGFYLSMTKLKMHLGNSTERNIDEI